ncbi:FAD-binding protein [Streptomyces sp. AV19]|uniref:FAD-dependent oxidoreductase n=1 Tax=Streptomyces sp. AV19 TaxID=2793068 RepID=UPI0018FE786B|nr:BBE domain-containing protein [Streptomyces sp. AV19]MBH1934218.1 FAD-binding protein [Streptomyces sp. AV19]MDG4536483.1 FAD-binding protein [Streptomyces sp. AV19]
MQWRVEEGDPRYETLSQGFNQRWVSKPSYIQLIHDDASALAAVREAVGNGLRPTVRSGGHCYEDFVANTDGAVLDLSLMNDVRKGTDKLGQPAHIVEAGATNWDVITTLFRRFGKAVPGGSCYSVGSGGHIAGGGFGFLSRRHGLVVDHLVQVDVVTVGDGPVVELTSAHRSDRGPEGDLFWAHTGGGGGNFGVVLRYYFADDIPEPPAHVWLSSIAWPWKGGLLDHPEDFGTLVGNFGEFFAAHSSKHEDVYQGLFSILKLTHKDNGNVVLLSQWDQEDPGPLDAYIRAIEAGVTTESTAQLFGVGGVSVHLPEKRRRMPWFQATQTLNGSGENQRGKYKSAYHRRPFEPEQIGTLYHWLTKEVPGADMSKTLVQADSYGCRINVPEPGDTAIPQRDSIFKLQYQSYWTDPGEDGLHTDYMRRWYAEMYRTTGGVPEITDEKHDRATDGAYVNYPDTDLGVAGDGTPAYPRLYYKGNYGRLQDTKRYWDPRDVFHHKQSIRLT